MRSSFVNPWVNIANLEHQNTQRSLQEYKIVYIKYAPISKGKDIKLVTVITLAMTNGMQAKMSGVQ